jgi:hypothetical protein
MLRWKETIKFTAHLDGYEYAIEEDNHGWAVEITDPGGGLMSDVCDTIEEATEFCENTAMEVGRG